MQYERRGEDGEGEEAEEEEEEEEEERPEEGTSSNLTRVLNTVLAPRASIVPRLKDGFMRGFSTPDDLAVDNEFVRNNYTSYTVAAAAATAAGDGGPLPETHMWAVAWERRRAVLATAPCPLDTACGPGSMSPEKEENSEEDGNDDTAIEIDMDDDSACAPDAPSAVDATGRSGRSERDENAGVAVGEGKRASTSLATGVAPKKRKLALATDAVAASGGDAEQPQRPKKKTKKPRVEDVGGVGEVAGGSQRRESPPAQTGTTKETGATTKQRKKKKKNNNKMIGGAAAMAMEVGEVIEIDSDSDGTSTGGGPSSSGRVGTVGGGRGGSSGSGDGGRTGRHATAEDKKVKRGKGKSSLVPLPAKAKSKAVQPSGGTCSPELASLPGTGAQNFEGEERRA
jgi:hypothetical protein